MNINVFIHKTADVSKDAKVGAGTKIWNQAQVREKATIGKDCIIGKSSYIDMNVIIGNNVKIQNFASVYDGVVLENNVFVGPSVTFTNDLYPRANSTSREWSKTLVKVGASIAAGAIIVCENTLGKHCMVGAGSVITKSIPDYGLAYGNPAKLKGFVCECGRKLSEIIKRNNLDVLYKCSSCNKEIKIPVEDFRKIVQ
ncbi:MAG: N-acetyltransferase [Nanohaloarchaea archaeon]|nr:N-acetyltransferase [Candidatus Nanohaloarchaea archaeon]